MFAFLVDIWRHLSLRSDVDDIILELLGRFSLEKIHVAIPSSPENKEAYQRLVKCLLAQLNVIFYLQRLTLPSESHQVSRFLGFLVSWEVALRSVEFVLQAITEGRDSLWDARSVRDKYLPDFLLSALRFLSLHPRPPANQRAKERRDRFARLHKSLELVADAYPGPKSFPLAVCQEITGHLQEDSNAFALPHRMRHELPNLASELVCCFFPFPCYIFTLIFSLLARPNMHISAHIKRQGPSTQCPLLLNPSPLQWDFCLTLLMTLINCRLRRGSSSHLSLRVISIPSHIACCRPTFPISCQATNCLSTGSPSS